MTDYEAAFRTMTDKWHESVKHYEDRIEKLEAALQFYVCSCNVRCSDFKKNSRCGYTARTALEEKDG